MSEMRHKTVRKKTVSAQRQTASAEEVIRTLKAFYIIMYNSEDSLIPLMLELFHLLGDILEGVPAKDLEVKGIDKATLLSTIEDLE